MVTLDQGLWNLLFGWTGRRCFIPEGCTVPLAELLLAAVIIAAIAAIIWNRQKLQGLLSEL